MAFPNPKKLGGEKIEINMTPMIDVVFQLMSFFIMTLKIVEVEGDFYVKMPPATAAAGSVTEALSAPLRLKLRADEKGELAGIILDERAFATFGELNQFIAGYIRSNKELADTAEVEIDADYKLKYEFTMKAITAVSGYITPDRQTVKLIEKIKFTPPNSQ